MDEVGDFMTTLRAFMAKAHRRATDLAKLTGISVRTIENWCGGVVRRPREIIDVIKIARALALNATEATTLLTVAGYDPLTILWTRAQRAGDTKLLDLLALWSSELERIEDSTHQPAPERLPSSFSIPPFPPGSIPLRTVIISSTLDHFPMYRSQVVDACLRQGLLAVHASLPTDSALEIAAVAQPVGSADQIYVGIYLLAENDAPMGFNVMRAQVEYDFFVRRSTQRVIVIASVPKTMPLTGRSEAAGAARWQDFRKRLEAENVVYRVESIDGLRAEVIDRLTPFRRTDEVEPRYIRDIPERPRPYIAHPYVFLQTKALIGRRTELEALTAWASGSAGPPNQVRVFNVVAVGGMGKSALTWTWFNEIPPTKMLSLAGQVWWSFYDSDATFENFVLRALSYATRKSPESLERDLTPPERENLLIGVLDRESFLIVLDGLERLLIAYARMDAPRLADDDLDAQTANRLADTPPIGTVGVPELDDRHRLRKTIDPRAGRFLRRLTTVRASRVLISSRLYPADLQSSTGLPLPGSDALFLQGLRGFESLQLWGSLGVSGSGDQLLPLFDTIDHHPLLIQALASTVAYDRDTPGDFNRWRHNHPDFNPFGLPVAERKTHILAYALQGLDDSGRRVLQTAAAFRMPIAHRALAMLFVGPGKSFTMDRELDRTLTDLEDRGLLGWDKPVNQYDLHPLVRGVVWAGMDTSRQHDAYEALHAYFGGLADLDNWQQVHKLDELTSSIELYNVLTGLGRYEEAWQLFSNELGNALLYRLSANRQRAELLELLFPDGLGQPPRLNDSFMQVYTCSALVQSYAESGQSGRAVTFFRQHKEDLQEEIGMVNLGDTLWPTGQLFETDLEAYNALYDSRELGMLFHEALSLRLCGWILAVCGQLDMGQRTLKQARRIFAEEDAPQFEGVTCAYLAQAAIWAERFDEAAALVERASQLAEVESQERDLTRVDRLRGTVSLYQGQIREAEGYLDQALMRARRSNIVEEEVLSLIAIARLRLSQGDYQTAFDILDEVWEPVERGPYPLYYADALNLLAQLEYERDARESAAVASMGAYQRAWCDGPPYAYHWGLQVARGHLASLGLAEPSMPPFDESRAGAMPIIDLEPPDEESDAL